MVLMSVRDYKALDFINILLKVRYIRNHQIDAQHVVLRKCDTAVHDYDRIFIFESRDVHTYLFKSPERYDLEGCHIFFCFFFLAHILLNL